MATQPTPEPDFALPPGVSARLVDCVTHKEYYLSRVARASTRDKSTVLSTSSFVSLSLESYIDTNVDAARLEARAT
jgi:hypothetical protein